MLVILIGGLYSAYKHFSGLDPLKIDPRALVYSLIGSKSPQELIAILSSLKLGQTKQSGGQNILSQIQIASTPIPQSPSRAENLTRSLSFKFALISDSHNDNVTLRKALAQIKKDYPTIKFIIGLGDYSEVGTIDELKAAKKELDSAGFRYFVIPGDHDLWDSRNKGEVPTLNYNQVFGPAFQSFMEDNFYFILINNSDNYLGLGESQLTWLANELDKAKQQSGIYLFAQEPLYHPSSDRVMGKVEGKLKLEAQRLVEMLSEATVKKVFFGDIHFFSEYEESQTGLPMVTIGAITSQRNTQAPRFAIAKVYSDGSIEVEDVEVK
ncbi:metallophosphoesterase [Candidatus Microgenomates bacterium]|nr:metallophosphoesterase [Candidatus Microgenomates bacterium]